MSNTDPNRPAGAHGTSTITGGPKKKGPNWLPWLLAALGILLLLLLLSQCGGDDREEKATTATEQTTTTTTTTDPLTTGTPGVTGAAGAGGATGEALGASTSVTTGLQAFLAGTDPTPRRFTFDQLNFASGSAELPGGASGTIASVAQVLNQHPNAAVRIEGYADARGSGSTNAELGAQRANAVAQALIAAGVPAGRVTAATGGETNPVDTNATASGQAENRRTDLVVTAR